MSRTSFNEGWKYGHLNEEWRKDITLPHDAMIYENRTADSPGGKNTGWYEGFDYVYEKKFAAPAEWRNSDLILEFEGVYRNAKVYVNGELAGGCAYGYTTFFVDIGKYLRFGEENVIRVEAFNADQPNSRWYSGAGIYRPVWLHTLPKAHIEMRGIKIKTLSYEPPRFTVSVNTNASGEVKAEIVEGGKAVASQSGKTEGEVKFDFTIPEAKLWSPESPDLYICRVTFGEDVREEKFGIRLLECDAKGGMRINGSRVILRGACIHHENGILGAVNHPFADARKIELLKKYGYNAIRSAHNPTSAATLEACDRLGMLVLDEYVDMWYIHKNKYDYASQFAEEWQNDLKALVERDYNHPCVIMYSTGNEVAETGQKKGIAFARQMTDYIHTMDDRPVTCGINIFFNLLYSLGFGIYSDKKADNAAKAPKKKKSVGSEFFNDLAGLLGATTMKIGATMPGCNAKTKHAFAAMDVAGYNYGIKRYKGDMKKYPDRVIVGSETFCADARTFWQIAKDHPALIGDFVWAGMDYLGEVGVGSWEHADYAPEFGGNVGWVSAGSGRLDLNGRPLAEALYTRVAFDLDPIRVGVVRPDKAFEKHSPSAWKLSGAWESWSWDGCDGKETMVEVYTACPRAALYINGKKVAEKKVGKEARAYFKVKYTPGELAAAGIDKKGNEVCRTVLKSAGASTKLTAEPELCRIGADDLCYIRLKYTDSNGVWKPLIRGDISVNVEGGELMALGSACPYNAEGYHNESTDTYFGEALAIIRPLKGAKKIALTAQSEYGGAHAEVAVE